MGLPELLSMGCCKLSISTNTVADLSKSMASICLNMYQPKVKTKSHYCKTKKSHMGSCSSWLPDYRGFPMRRLDGVSLYLTGFLTRSVVLVGTFSFFFWLECPINLTINPPWPKKIIFKKLQNFQLAYSVGKKVWIGILNFCSMSEKMGWLAYRTSKMEVRGVAIFINPPY